MNEIIRNLPFADYKARAGLNFSTLKHILTSPAHFAAAFGKPDQPSTADQRLGSIFHAGVLEDRFEFVIKPEDMSFSTKEGKAWKAARPAGVEILSCDEAERIRRMSGSVAKHAYAQGMLATCQDREVSIFVDYRNVRIKARLDAAHLGIPAVLDLKKCKDASPRGWANAVIQYRYLTQAALYSTALALATGSEKPPAWAWLCVEDSDAAPVCIYRPTEDQLAIGQRQLDRAIDIYLECSETGLWPGYGDGELTLELPKWWEREQEAQL